MCDSSRPIVTVDPPLDVVTSSSTHEGGGGGAGASTGGDVGSIHVGNPLSRTPSADVADTFQVTRGDARSLLQKGIIAAPSSNITAGLANASECEEDVPAPNMATESIPPGAGWYRISQHYLTEYPDSTGIAFRMKPDEESKCENTFESGLSTSTLPNTGSEAIGIIVGTKDVKYLCWRGGYFSPLHNPRDPPTSDVWFEPCQKPPTLEGAGFYRCISRLHVYVAPNEMSKKIGTLKMSQVKEADGIVVNEQGKPFLKWKQSGCFSVLTSDRGSGLCVEEERVYGPANEVQIHASAVGDPPSVYRSISADCIPIRREPNESSAKIGTAEAATTGTLGYVHIDWGEDVQVLEVVPGDGPGGQSDTYFRVQHKRIFSLDGFVPSHMPGFPNIRLFEQVFSFDGLLHELLANNQTQCWSCQTCGSAVQPSALFCTFPSCGTARYAVHPQVPDWTLTMLVPGEQQTPLDFVDNCVRCRVKFGLTKTGWNTKYNCCLCGIVICGGNCSVADGDLRCCEDCYEKHTEKAKERAKENVKLSDEINIQIAQILCEDKFRIMHLHVLLKNEEAPIFLRSKIFHGKKGGLQHELYGNRQATEGRPQIDKVSVINDGKLIQLNIGDAQYGVFKEDATTGLLEGGYCIVKIQNYDTRVATYLAAAKQSKHKLAQTYQYADISLYMAIYKRAASDANDLIGALKKMEQKAQKWTLNPEETDIRISALRKLQILHPATMDLLVRSKEMLENLRALGWDFNVTVDRIGRNAMDAAVMTESMGAISTLLLWRILPTTVPSDQFHDFILKHIFCSAILRSTLIEIDWKFAERLDSDGNNIVDLAILRDAKEARNDFWSIHVFPSRDETKQKFEDDAINWPWETHSDDIAAYIAHCSRSELAAATPEFIPIAERKVGLFLKGQWETFDDAATPEPRWNSLLNATKAFIDICITDAMLQTEILEERYKATRDGHKGMYRSTMSSVKRDPNFETYVGILNELDIRIATRLSAQTYAALQSSNNLWVLYNGARSIQERYEQFMTVLAAKTGCEYTIGDRKNPFRCFEKSGLAVEQWIFEKGKDLIRGAQTMPDVNKGLQLLQLFLACDPTEMPTSKERGWDAAQAGITERIAIVGLKNRLQTPTSGGWSDALLTFYFLEDPQKHICEVQLVHADMMRVRKQMGAHKGYAVFRCALELLEATGHSDLIAEIESRTVLSPPATPASPISTFSFGITEESVTDVANNEVRNVGTVESKPSLIVPTPPSSPRLEDVDARISSTFEEDSGPPPAAVLATASMASELSSAASVSPTDTTALPLDAVIATLQRDMAAMARQMVTQMSALEQSNQFLLQENAHLRAEQAAICSRLKFLEM